eukprot:7128437-Ditylum_brightwellii.AAC.1
MGYEESTVLQLLQHLYDNYGQLTPTQLTANDKEMRADYDPTTLIEKYIAKIKKCMDIAANGGAPYSQEQILTLAFDAMCCTGRYNDKCITWEDMAPADKTWLNWKIFFMKVIWDKHRLQRAAGTSYN